MVAASPGPDKKPERPEACTHTGLQSLKREIGQEDSRVVYNIDDDDDDDFDLEGVYSSENMDIDSHSPQLAVKSTPNGRSFSFKVKRQVSSEDLPKPAPKLQKRLDDFVSDPVTEESIIEIDSSPEPTESPLIRELSMPVKDQSPPAEIVAKQLSESDVKEAGKPVLKRESANSDPPSSTSKRTGRRTASSNVTYNLKKISRQSLDPSRWSEPTLSPPVPSVTGYPLETLPPLKLRKKALWPRKKNVPKKAKKKSSVDLSEPNTTRETSVDPEESSADQDEVDDVATKENIKKMYDSKLRTQDSDDLTMASTERLPTHQKIQPVQKNGLDEFKLLIPTKHRHHLAEDRKKNVKQSPRKPRTNGYGQAPAEFAEFDSLEARHAGSSSDATKDNDDFCSACGHSGIFLCCEGCPRSFHFVCCDPPYDESNLPEGSWFCRECLAKRSAPKKHHIGIFSKLMNQAEMRNPRAFQLPKKLRELYEGVTTNTTGEYLDHHLKPEKTVKLGRLEETDPNQIYDKDGKPLVCYRCKESGIHGKQITQCEYCPLAWHLDCLDPPLAIPKTLGTRWKCPNHADDLVPSRRRQKKHEVVDVSMTRGFANDGDIEVMNMSEDSDYIRDEDHDFDGDDDYDHAENLPTPPYFDIHTTKDGVAAPITEHQFKVMQGDNVVYRIPEKGIVLDFIETTKRKKMEEVAKIERENQQLASELDPTKREFVEDVSAFSGKSLGLRLDIGDLVKAALGESQVDTEQTLSREEIEDLMRIKKLMEFKGRDKLLAFLEV